MKIYHYTTNLTGGAGIAAKRLHLSLVAKGESSRLIFGNAAPSPSDSNWYPVARSFPQRVQSEITDALLRKTCVNPSAIFTSPRGVRRTHLSDFGPLPGIVNLHWVARWLDLPSFFDSLPECLPVVWSLHDLSPATGGCHLPGECRQFEVDCSRCPMIREPLQKIVARRFWRMRRKAYKNINLHVVGNSTWTTNQVRDSSLLRAAKSFTTIPLGLDLTEYQAIPKGVAREALCIEDGGLVVGFACADVSDKNKNMRTLLDVLARLSVRHSITLVSMGDGQPPEIPGNLKMLHLSGLSSPTMQSIFYSCLDVFVMPSKMETFGLAALEALACGTPVVAYRTGGLPDFVIDGKTGWLAPDPSDPEGLIACLEGCLIHPDLLAAMSANTREHVRRNYSIEQMSASYVELYRNILKDV